MKISAKQRDSQLVVELKDVSNKDEVVQVLQSCAEGACSCSSDEYAKVETMQILSGPSSIQLDISVKAGEIIDVNCISECLSPFEEQRKK